MWLFLCHDFNHFWTLHIIIEVACFEKAYHMAKRHTTNDTYQKYYIMWYASNHGHVICPYIPNDTNQMLHHVIYQHPWPGHVMCPYIPHDTYQMLHHVICKKPWRGHMIYPYIPNATICDMPATMALMFVCQLQVNILSNNGPDLCLHLRPTSYHSIYDGTFP